MAGITSRKAVRYRTANRACGAITTPGKWPCISSASSVKNRIILSTKRKMSAKQLTDLSDLCVHTITTKPWPIEEAAKHFAKAGIGGITVWRDALTGRDIH